MTATIEDEWLWGWDATPGIVSVWADGNGLVHVWRRVAGQLVHETARFRPWVLTSSIDGLPASVTTRELGGLGELRYVVRGDDMRSLSAAVLAAATPSPRKRRAPRDRERYDGTRVEPRRGDRD